MYKSIESNCTQCGEKFVLSQHQIFNLRHKGRVFCSKKCITLSRGFVIGGDRKTSGACKTCGKEFESAHGNKYFCSLDCYLKDPKSKERLKSMAKKGNMARCKKLGIIDAGYTKINCAFCGIKKKVKKSQVGKRNFCNSLCYRVYMADRFDRWIASPQTIALPQNYDEFLTQEILPCPVDGCDWEGSFLSAHANFEHGIPAEEFKKLVGFNLSTGLVSPDLSKRMRESALARGDNWLMPGYDSAGPNLNKYKSLESKEHYKKSRALCAAIVPDKFIPCRFCGKMVRQNYFGQTLYCSTTCRSKYYYQKGKCHSLLCSFCGKKFIGSAFQKKQHDGGKGVVCSITCRNRKNPLGRKKTRIMA